ncbi:MAG: 3-deoxy-7-phosphoheptulonate synthase [Bacteroidales bacterium]|nr:3-deoxy-7-phosphoheptulonate synthase [Bacteroidales bacterium]
MNHLTPLFPGVFTDDRPIIIAGPCSAETEEQTLCTAQALAQSGIRVFRAGVWKPRTKPGAFEGVGAKALEWLVKVRENTGMAVACEVATAEHTRLALETGIDALWLGARTSANPFAVQEIADTLKGSDVAVMVKNPVSPDLELWIGALQRIYNAGIRRIAAVHRGFPSYGAHVYRNQPQWNIPIELRLRYPHLPVIVDPSHIGGRRSLIAPLSQQALDMGFAGLMIESHCAPEEALSDSAQQLTPHALSSMLQSLEVRPRREETDTLDSLRRQIDDIDAELLDVLARRMEISRVIGKYKSEHRLPVVQPARYNDVISDRVAQGLALGMDERFLRTLLLAIHDESVRQQLSE